jgi:hypothetical protein
MQCPLKTPLLSTFQIQLNEVANSPICSIFQSSSSAELFLDAIGFFRIAQNGCRNSTAQKKRLLSRSFPSFPGVWANNSERFEAARSNMCLA